MFRKGQSRDLLCFSSCCSGWVLFFLVASIPRQSWILNSRFLLELGFWIPIVSGIPYSWSWVPHSKGFDSNSRTKNFPDSRFQKQKFSGFRIPQAEISWIPEFTRLSKISMIVESGLPYTGRIVRFSSRWGSATDIFALVGKTASLY